MLNFIVLLTILVASIMLGITRRTSSMRIESRLTNRCSKLWMSMEKLKRPSKTTERISVYSRKRPRAQLMLSKPWTAKLISQSSAPTKTTNLHLVQSMPISQTSSHHLITINLATAAPPPTRRLTAQTTPTSAATRTKRAKSASSTTCWKSKTKNWKSK